jgi:phosphoribosylanthranilate isomerase
MVKVKICGTTNEEDALLAKESGADFIGMIIDVPSTKRKISLGRAIEISNAISANLDRPKIVSVLMPRKIDEVQDVVEKVQPYAVQLHGYESTEFMREIKSKCETKIIKTVHIDSNGNIRPNRLDELEEVVDFFLLDSIKVGETGIKHDWSISKTIKDKTSLRVILAGGLTPENVDNAIGVVDPYAVDVASGVELYPGKKDHEKVRAFIEAVRSSD